MSIHVPLPLTVFPEPGEAFAGYMERLAEKLHYTLVGLLYIVGIIDDDAPKDVQHGYGVSLPERKIATFAAKARLKESEVRGLLLSSLDGICVDLSDVESQGQSLRVIGLREWVYLSGSNYCPQCLLESGGVWQLSWKLPWTFACLKHRVLLKDSCPNCHRRPQSWRLDNSTKPRYLKHHPRSWQCSNAISGSLVHERHSTELCGQDLRKVEAESIDSHPFLFEAQQAINQVLEAGYGSIAGETISSKEYFDCLKTICQLLLYAADADDLEKEFSIPKSCIGEFRSHCDRRARALGSQTKKTHAKAPKFKASAGVPDELAILAAMLPTAYWIVSCDTLPDFAERLAWLIKKARSRIAKVNLLAKFFIFPPIFRRAFDLLRQSTASFDRRMGSLAPIVGKGWGRSYDISPDNIPQVLPEELYNSQFASMFPEEIRPLDARRVCSAALVKLTGNYTWEEAAGCLQLPKSRVRGMANKLMGIIRHSPHEAAFTQALHGIVADLEASRSRVDYGRRRALLSQYRVIPASEWSLMAVRRGLHSGQIEGKSKYSAAWVWARVTQGDWRLAPALEEMPVEIAREVYRRFLSKDFPVIEADLEEYVHVLEEFIDAHQTVEPFLRSHWFLRVNKQMAADLSRSSESVIRPGTRNRKAHGFVRLARTGDLVFLIQGTGRRTAVIATAKVVGSLIADPEQFIRKSPYFDPSSSRDTPNWYTLKIGDVEYLSGDVLLSEVRTQRYVDEFNLTSRWSSLAIIPCSRDLAQDILRSWGKNEAED